MEKYLHRIVGVYETRAAADAVSLQLVRRGMPADDVKILEPGRAGDPPEAQADSDDVLKEMLREGAIGTAVGTLAGAAGTAALALDSSIPGFESAQTGAGMACQSRSHKQWTEVFSWPVLSVEVRRNTVGSARCGPD